MFPTLRRPSASHQKLPLLWDPPLSLAVPCSHCYFYICLSPDPGLNPSLFVLLKRCQWTQESNKQSILTLHLKYLHCFPHPKIKMDLCVLPSIMKLEKCEFVEKKHYKNIFRIPSFNHYPPLPLKAPESLQLSLPEGF